MGLRLICAGLFFFLIPSYGLIDVMPDCIGAFLILLALSKLRDTDGRLEDAYRLFSRFFFIELARTLLAFPIHGLKDGNGDSDIIAVLTACFVFSIISGILLYHGLSRLFSGINYIATRASSRSADENYNGVRIMTGIFSVAYYVLLVIPQLVSLSKPSYQMATDTAQLYSLYDSRTIITMMCMIASLLLSVLFVSTGVGYLHRLARDGETVERMRELYLAATKEKCGAITCRKLASCLVFVIFGILFTVSFKVNGVNAIPHSVAFALMAVGSFKLAKFVPRAKVCAVISLVFTAVDGGIFVFCGYVGDRYFQSTTDDATSKILKAFKAGAECAEYVMYAALFILLFGVLCRLVEAHTGREYVDPDSFQAKQSLDEKKALKNLLRNKFLISGLTFCTFGCVFSVLGITNEAAWLLPQAAAVIYCIVSAKAFLKLHDGISNKYL